LFEKDAMNWLPTQQAGLGVRMGEMMGEIMGEVIDKAIN
jgi:hypothetical protein